MTARICIHDLTTGLCYGIRQEWKTKTDKETDGIHRQQNIIKLSIMYMTSEVCSAVDAKLKPQNRKIDDNHELLLAFA